MFLLRRCRSTSSSTRRSSSPTERRGPSSCGRGAGREDAERDRGGGRVKRKVYRHWVFFSVIALLYPGHPHRQAIESTAMIKNTRNLPPSAHIVDLYIRHAAGALPLQIKIKHKVRGSRDKGIIPFNHVQHDPSARPALSEPFLPAHTHHRTRAPGRI